jgi:hypothetical protein
MQGIARGNEFFYFITGTQRAFATVFQTYFVQNYLNMANLFHRGVLVYIAQNLSYLGDRVVSLCVYRR